MSDTSWRLQDAKAQFSAVVEAALGGEAQHVTRRGKSAVVVIAEEDYRRLQSYARAATPGFVAHLLAMPRGAATAAVRGKATQPVVRLRDVDFG